jgi:hypothetical protein
MSNDDESFSGFTLVWNRSFMRLLGLVVAVTAVCCCWEGDIWVQWSCCWVVIASNAVVLPSNKPWRGSMVGKELFTLDDGESVWVVLLILVVKPSWPASKERVVSPFGKLVTLVNELFGVRKSSMLYLQWILVY